MLVNKMRALFIEEEGQGMTEYGLILGVIAIAVIAAVGLLGDSIKTLIDNVITQLNGAVSSTSADTSTVVE